MEENLNQIQNGTSNPESKGHEVNGTSNNEAHEKDEKENA